MTDAHYPTVDLTFLLDLIQGSSKVQGTLNIGKTTAYILKGKGAIGKRTINIRANEGFVDYECATGIAIKLKCMGELSEWLKTERGWKEGAYFIS